MRNLKKRFPIYSNFLKLYPKNYQRKYNYQTLQTTADMIDASESSLNSRLKIWVLIAIDLAKTIPKENICTIDSRKYIPKSFMISSVLLVPLAVNILLVNFASPSVLATDNIFALLIYGSPFILLWTIVCPLISFILATIGLIVLYQNEKITKKPLLRPFAVGMLLLGITSIAILICFLITIIIVVR